MKVTIVTDVILHNYEGHFYLSTAFGTILKRYSDSFGKVALISRITDKKPSSKYVCVDEYIERVTGVESLLSPFSNNIRKQIIDVINESDLVVGRLASVLVCRLYRVVKKLNKHFFSEMMSDPWDAYWNHSLKGKIIAPYMYVATKRIVKHSDYALYVTNHFLQKRYPCKNETVGVSNVKIASPSKDVLEKRIMNQEAFDGKNVVLMTTAAVNVKYKGHEYVIKAIPKLNKLGIAVRYIMVGDGDQSYLKRVAKKHGVLNQIDLKGLMSLDEVFSTLDKIDVYIQPSLQEGLPRSVIEAMSRGCPCIGARTAGIPELIEDRFVVKRKSVNDIVDKVKMFCDMSTEERKDVAIRNFDEAKKYTEDVLNKRRNEYYAKVKKDFEG